MADELPIGSGVVVFKQHALNQQIRNVFGIAPRLDQVLIANTIVTSAGSLADEFRGVKRNDWFLDEIECRVQTAPGVVEVAIWTTGVGSGSDQNGVLPALHNAMLVSWKTNKAGKANRGRSYLVGWGSDFVSGQYWTAAALASARTFLDGWMALFGPAGTVTMGQAAVIHRPYDAGEVLRKVNHQWALVNRPAYAGGFEPIQSYVVHDLIATQRRRRVGVGI